jgi:hypothetical protein
LEVILFLVERSQESGARMHQPIAYSYDLRKWSFRLRQQGILHVLYVLFSPGGAKIEHTKAKIRVLV